VIVPVVVPSGGNGRGVRLLLRARSRGGEAGEVIFGSAAHLTSYSKEGEIKEQRGLPSIDQEHSVRILVPAGAAAIEVWQTLPSSVGAKPGQSTRFVVYGGRDTEIEAFAVVPLADELPPPAPKPWQEKGQGAAATGPPP
jgi:hypothetical protein